jgi:hypothetical protein
MARKTMSLTAARRKRKTARKRGKSGIVIRKPGSFTAWCKRQGFSGVTSECIAKGLKSKNAAIRKKANFARNSRGWRKGTKRRRK